MRSMTGFGQAIWQGGGRRIAVEVRSVNQRFLDVRIGLPRECQHWEEPLKQAARGAAARGKVEVGVHLSGTASGNVAVEINEPLARAWLEGCRRLQRRLGVKGEIDIGRLIERGDFVRLVERGDGADSDLPRVRRLLKTALAVWNRARTREGQALARDMRARLSHLRRIERALRLRSKKLVPELSRRLAERVNKLLANQKVSEDRLLQETALAAERSDVTEELVRLASHLDRFADLLRGKGPVGKAMDFLLQEMHREINTIASKSADLEVTNLTLEARGEIEKLREQVQNVE